MKNFKLFKRSALLLAVVVLAVVLTVGAIAGAALLSDEGSADYGEQYAGVKVGTSGKVSLKFYYSTTGTAEKFVAEVIDPETGTTETQYFAVADLEETTDGFCVPVALAPSQMTHTVKIYASDASGTSGNGAPIVYSVKEYAEDVLADASKAEYHDAMRALLNWGAMAQGYFGDATGTLANADVYARGTNPINAVKEIVAGDATVANGTAITANKYALSLEQDNLAIHFYVNYAGDASQLTATVERVGLAAVSTSVDATETAGVYRVRVANVNASLFATPYTVKVSAGDDTCTITASVLNNLASLVEANGEEAATAKAMYQFYQNVENVAVADCAHGATYWANNGEDADLRCSVCFADLGQNVANSVEFVYTPYQLVSNTHTNNSATIMENGAYARVSKNKITTDGYSFFTPVSNNTTVSARYLIFKVRYGENGLGQTNARIYAAWDEAQAWSFPISEDNKWHTIIIDTNKAEGYKPEMIHFRWFNGYDATKVDGAYTMLGDSNDYVDVQYIVMADSLAEAKSFIDTDTYELAYSATGKAVVNTATGACVSHYYTTSVKNNNDGSAIYSATCAVCGTVAASQTVSADINYFAPLGSMGVYTVTGKLTTDLVEDGVIFNRFTTTGGCHLNITGGDGAGNATSTAYPTGKYVTFKYRTTGGGSLSVAVATGDKKSSNGKYINGDGTHGDSQQVPNQPVGEWRVAILDASQTAQWTSDGSKQTIYSMWLQSGAATVDIAYFAVVDSIDEAISLMGENDQLIYDYGNDFTQVGIAKDKATGECAHKSGATETLTADACTYKCNNCGETIFEYDLSGVSVFFSAYNLSQATGSKNETNPSLNNNKLTPSTYFQMNNKKYVFDSNAPYFGFDGTSADNKTSQFIWMRSAQDTGNASAYERYFVDIGQANYLVIKMRGSENALTDVPVSYSTSGYTGSVSIGLPLAAAGADEWGTYVIDLSKVAGSAHAKNTETGTYELDFFMFSLYPFLADDHVDFAYIAFAEDWAGVSALVKEDTVYKVVDRNRNYTEVTTDDGACVGDCSYALTVNGTVYTYACVGCGKVDRTFDVANINYFAPLSGMNYYNNAGTSLVKDQFDMTEILAYNRYAATEGTHWNFTGGGGAGAATGTAYNSGSYIIMKVRAYGETKAGLCLYASTDGTTNVAAGHVGTFYVEPEDGWTVIILKNPVNSNSKYALNTNAQLYFMGMPQGNDRKMDIAYLAVTDSLEEAMVLLKNNETYKLYEGTFATYKGHYDQDGLCVEHEYQVKNVNGACTYVCVACGHNGGAAEHGSYNIVADGTYKTVCTVCGSTIRDTGASVNATDLYWSAEKLYSMAAVASKWTGTVSNIDLVTDGGETFLRLADAKTNGQWCGWFPETTNGANHPGAGRYMVIKVRQNNNSVNSTVLPFWVTSTGGFAGSWAAGGFEVYLPEDNQWHTIVVDLATRAGSTAYAPDTNGEYGPRTVHIRPFGGYTQMDTPTDEVLDIAYISFFNDLSDIKNIIAEDTYEWSVNNSTNYVRDTQTHGCAVHTPVESVNGSTYTYSCSECGQVVKTIALDDSVTKYYSANALNTTAKVYYGGSGNSYKYDVDANVGYMETSRIQTIWQRMDHDMATTQTASAGEQYSVNVGNAKYLVVKARSSDAAAYIRFCISTTAKNCAIGTVTEADFTDGVLNKTIATYKKILEDGSTESALCSAVGDQYYHGSSTKSVFLMGKGEATGEWVTYVIDLEAVCGEYYAKLEGQDYYDVDSFYFHNEGTSDIAYVAFVEGGWAEIDALVEESVVTQITAGGSNTATVSQQVNVADGSAAN
ncbi:MAG: hypothetical protein E7611_03460 [Ruminococcaceae bacterium]|nr:hypothetical protein [Oscillospiraceae bacterium]